MSRCSYRNVLSSNKPIRDVRLVHVSRRTPNITPPLLHARLAHINRRTPKLLQQESWPFKPIDESILKRFQVSHPLVLRLHHGKFASCSRALASIRRPIDRLPSH
jgi:hypothetical protein